jgi:hypothetical protein
MTRELEWLKENNQLFANISISTSRLAQLPEDDVPYELQAVTKHSTDVNMLYAEQDSYVPSQETGDDDNEGETGSISAGSSLMTHELTEDELESVSDHGEGKTLNILPPSFSNC